MVPAKRLIVSVATDYLSDIDVIADQIRAAGCVIPLNGVLPFIGQIIVEKPSSVRATNNIWRVKGVEDVRAEQQFTAFR